MEIMNLKRVVARYSTYQVPQALFLEQLDNPYIICVSKLLSQQELQKNLKYWLIVEILNI